jgi:hypothetical protein
MERYQFEVIQLKLENDTLIEENAKKNSKE